MIALPCAPPSNQPRAGFSASKNSLVTVTNVQRRTEPNDCSAPCCLVNRRKREFIIDADDLALASKFKWSAHRIERLQYAVTKTKDGQRFSLHRLLVGVPGLVVDHVNRNGLDNRRSNLRLCTHAENMRNRARRKDCSSGFKGVRARVGKTTVSYEAEIRAHGIKYRLGTFATAEAAHAAYVEAAKRLHGEFARAA